VKFDAGNGKEENSTVKGTSVGDAYGNLLELRLG